MAQKNNLYSMFNFDKSDWSSLIYNLIFLVILLSSFFIRTSTERGSRFRQLAIWLAVIFIGVIVYNNKHLLGNFVPYLANDIGENMLEIQMSNDRHFYITLNLNGKNVLFLIDTGATTTSLTMHDASRIGIDTSNLHFNQMVSTANGATYNASAEVRDVKLGQHSIGSMWVLVSKDLSGNSLLGMNFLNRLNGYDIRKDRMILYY